MKDLVMYFALVVILGTLILTLVELNRYALQLAQYEQMVNMMHYICQPNSYIEPIT